MGNAEYIDPTSHPALYSFADRVKTRVGNPPVVLSIAGSDPSAGAGIQADLKTFAALGVYGTSVITTITAQNTQSVNCVYPLDVQLVRDQLRSVLEDCEIAAIKIGLLGSMEIALMLESELSDVVCPIILDPVFRATSGASFFDSESIPHHKTALFNMAFLVTPNIPEAEAMTGISIDSIDSLQKAAKQLRASGIRNVLIKGGHSDDNEATDLLLTGKEVYFFTSPKIETNNLHGTGCTMSSAIAASLAHGYDLPNAVRIAKEYVAGAIESAKDRTIGNGNGPLDHEWLFREPSLLQRAEELE